MLPEPWTPISPEGTPPGKQQGWCWQVADFLRLEVRCSRLGYVPSVNEWRGEPRETPSLAAADAVDRGLRLLDMATDNLEVNR